MQRQPDRETSEVTVTGEVIDIVDKRTATGTRYAIVNVSMKRREGDTLQPFVECSLFGRAFERYRNKLFVGDLAKFSGELRGFPLTDRQGTPRCRVSVYANEVTIIEKQGQRAEFEASTERW